MTSPWSRPRNRNRWSNLFSKGGVMKPNKELYMALSLHLSPENAPLFLKGYQVGLSQPAPASRTWERNPELLPEKLLAPSQGGLKIWDHLQ
jgi:hypothetical protein